MAILRYAGADIADPTTNQTTSVIPLNETSVHVCLVNTCQLMTNNESIVPFSPLPA